MLKIYFLFVILLNIQFVWSNIELQLCSDPKCKAQVETDYSLPNINEESKYLKLNNGDFVNVRAKDAHSTHDGLWYGECNNNYGYFPKNIVKEIQIFNDDLLYIVPSEFVDKNSPVYESYVTRNEEIYQSEQRRKQTSQQRTEDSNSQQNASDSTVDVVESQVISDEAEPEQEAEEKQKVEEEEEERRRAEQAAVETEEERLKQIAVEEEHKRLQEKEEALRVAKQKKEEEEEEERKRLAEEAEAKQKKLVEAERLQKEQEEEEERKRQEAEKKKLAEQEEKEKEQRRVELEKRRLQEEEEAEKRRKAAEQEQKLREEEEEERKRIELERQQKEEHERQQLEAEKKRKEEMRKKEEDRRRQQEDEQRKRVAEEEAKRVEAEKKQKEAADQAAKRQQEQEEERKRVEREEAEKKAKEQVAEANERKLSEERQADEVKKSLLESDESKRTVADATATEPIAAVQPETVNNSAVSQEDQTAGDTEPTEQVDGGDASGKAAKKTAQEHFQSKFHSLNKQKEETHQHSGHTNDHNDDGHHHHGHGADSHQQHHHHHHHNDGEHVYHDEQNETSGLATNQNETSTGTISVNDNTNVKVLHASNSHPIRFCADLKPLKDIFNQIESYYSPLLLLLPENLQFMLLENIPIMGMSTASCLLILFTSLSIVLVLLLCARKTDRKKMNSNSNLNEAILALELKIQDLNFEKQTFTTKLLEMEKDVADKQADKEQAEKSLSELKERYVMSEENDRKAMDLLNRKHDTLKVNYTTVCDSEAALRQEVEFLKQENKRIELENLSLIDATQNTIQMGVYEELEVKVKNLQDESAVREQQLCEYKRDCGEYEKRIEELQVELSLKEKSINILQDAIMKDAASASATGHLETINEDETVANKDSEANPETKGFIENLMDVANLQNRIQSLEQQLREEEIKHSVNETTKEKLELEIEALRKDYTEVKFKSDELTYKIKEYEMQLRLINDLRKKDLELNVKAYSELDAQLKKKSSDAEKASHLLEQLKLKQERIQELETQIARIEKNSTQERQTFEKQAHENWLSARKYEKEAKEAKQETKLWKEKYNEAEQYKESTLLRPLPINKIPVSAYMQPIGNHHVGNQHSSDTVDASPAKSTHESSVERERPPSSSSNSGFIPHQQHQHQQQQQQQQLQQQSQPMYMSPNAPMPPHPMFMRGIPPPHMYRPPFPGPFMAPRMPMTSMTPQFDRNTTSSPDMGLQYMQRMQPLSVPPQMMANGGGNVYPSPPMRGQSQSSTTPLPLLQSQQQQQAQLSPAQHHTNQSSFTYQNNDKNQIPSSSNNSQYSNGTANSNAISTV